MKLLKEGTPQDVKMHGFIVHYYMHWKFLYTTIYTKLWSPQLHISNHLHVVIKEHMHTSATHTLIPLYLKKKSIARSRFAVSGNWEETEC